RGPSATVDQGTSSGSASLNSSSSKADSTAGSRRQGEVGEVRSGSAIVTSRGGRGADATGGARGVRSAAGREGGMIDTTRGRRAGNRMGGWVDIRHNRSISDRPNYAEAVGECKGRSSCRRRPLGHEPPRPRAEVGPRRLARRVILDDKPCAVGVDPEVA